MNDLITGIQDWFKEQCNEDWEHSYGISIETLDNPGWHVIIDLSETDIELKPFTNIERDINSDTDWLHCFVKDSKFEGTGSPDKLEEILLIFLEWARN
jgi:hypothetical protein